VSLGGKLRPAKDTCGRHSSPERSQPCRLGTFEYAAYETLEPWRQGLIAGGIRQKPLRARLRPPRCLPSSTRLRRSYCSSATSSCAASPGAGTGSSVVLAAVVARPQSLGQRIAPGRETTTASKTPWILRRPFFKRLCSSLRRESSQTNAMMPV